MDERLSKNLFLVPGDDPQATEETQKEDKLPRLLSSSRDTTCTLAPPIDTESSLQPAGVGVGPGVDSTSYSWILSVTPEQQPKAPPAPPKVLQKDDIQVLRLLLHQRDLEIQGLKRAAQKEPSARLPFILQELVSKRQKASATCMRSQTKRDQQEHLQKEIDRLSSEREAEKALHMKEMKILKERLYKSELLVQQLYKEVERLEKSELGRPTQSVTELQEAQVIVDPEILKPESFELWSEMNCIATESSNMTLRRIPKHTSFLESFFKDKETELEMEKADSKAQISEIVQGEFNIYGTSSNDSEARRRVGDFNNFTSSQELAGLSARKERELQSENSGWDVISSPKAHLVLPSPRWSEVAILLPRLPSSWEIIQSKHFSSFDLNTGQPQYLCPLIHTSLNGIYVSKTSAVSSDLSKGEECERASEDTGVLKIATVNHKFIRILNTSLDQEMDLSSFIIQQWIGGYPVSIYRFPLQTTLPALHHVTVWATGADHAHKPPKEVTLRAQQYFRAGPECTTVLSNAKGQILSRYTAPHRRTAAADAYLDNTDLSVDKFPLPEEGEEAEEPLPWKDPQWMPAAPRRGSTRRPPAALQQQARDKPRHRVRSLNSKRLGDPAEGDRRKIHQASSETVYKTVAFSAHNLPPISGAVKERDSFFSLGKEEKEEEEEEEEEQEQELEQEQEQEKEDFAPCERQPTTAEPKPRVFKTTLNTTIPTVALIGQKSARSKYGFKHMAYLPTTTNIQLRRYCPAR